MLDSFSLHLVLKRVKQFDTMVPIVETLFLIELKQGFQWSVVEVSWHLFFSCKAAMTLVLEKSLCSSCLQILPEKYSYYRRFDQDTTQATDCVICMTAIDLTQRSNDCMVWHLVFCGFVALPCSWLTSNCIFSYRWLHAIIFFIPVVYNGGWISKWNAQLAGDHYHQLREIIPLPLILHRIDWRCPTVNYGNHLIQTWGILTIRLRFLLRVLLTCELKSLHFTSLGHCKTHLIKGYSTKLRVPLSFAGPFKSTKTNRTTGQGNTGLRFSFSLLCPLQHLYYKFSCN